MARFLLAAWVVVSAVPFLRAIPFPEGREDAEVVVVGTIEKLTSSARKQRDKSVTTTYTARVKVMKIEKLRKGTTKEVVGKTVTVSWTSLTKESPLPPGKRLEGDLFVTYPVKEKDRVRVWLRKEGKGWGLINVDAIEKLMK